MASLSCSLSSLVADHSQEENHQPVSCSRHLVALSDRTFESGVSSLLCSFKRTLRSHALNVSSRHTLMLPMLSTNQGGCKFTRKPRSFAEIASFNPFLHRILLTRSNTFVRQIVNFEPKIKLPHLAIIMIQLSEESKVVHDLSCPTPRLRTSRNAS